MRQRVVLFSLALLALVACQHERVSFVPDAMQDVAPIPAQVDPELWALTERWATWCTSGEASVGEVLPRILVDDPQALLRLTYVTSHLTVSTVVSRIFYRPNLHRARYQLTVRVESPAIGVGQAFIEGRGEGQSTVSAGRASQEAITQAVRALARTLDALTRRG
jgi:hypothetical protein